MEARDLEYVLCKFNESVVSTNPIKVVFHEDNHK